MNISPSGIRLALLEGQLAEDARIAKMHEGRIQRLKREYEQETAVLIAAHRRMAEYEREINQIIKEAKRAI